MPPLYLTFALMTCCFSSISSARVILSLNALELGATPSAVGLLVATFYTFPLLLSWPVGVLSDRLGSRWLLFAGAACGAGAGERREPARPDHAGQHHRIPTR